MTQQQSQKRKRLNVLHNTSSIVPAASDTVSSATATTLATAAIRVTNPAKTEENHCDTYHKKMKRLNAKNIVESSSSNTATPVSTHDEIVTNATAVTHTSRRSSSSSSSSSGKNCTEKLNDDSIEQVISINAASADYDVNQQSRHRRHRRSSGNSCTANANANDDFTPSTLLKNTTTATNPSPTTTIILPSPDSNSRNESSSSSLLLNSTSGTNATPTDNIELAIRRSSELLCRRDEDNEINKIFQQQLCLGNNDIIDNSNGLQQIMIIEYQQKLLLLVHHVWEDCSSMGHCSKNCTMMTRLLQHHIQFCTAGIQCPAQHCFETKCVLTHYNTCNEASCPICFPVETIIQQRRLAAAAPRYEYHAKSHSNTRRRHRLPARTTTTATLDLGRCCDDDTIRMMNDPHRQQQRLLLLHHATECTHFDEYGTPCPVNRHCAETKLLVEHIRMCSTDCSEYNCLSSQCLLAHYYACRDPICLICYPVRRRGIQRDNGSSKIQLSTTHCESLNTKSTFRAEADHHKGFIKATDLDQYHIENTTNKNQQQHIIRCQQKRILLLHHASECTHDSGTECPVTQHCTTAKKVVDHIGVCNDDSCSVKYCLTSRCILSHYRSCKDEGCSCCSPVRSAIQGNYAKKHKNTTAKTASKSINPSLTISTPTTNKVSSESGTFASNTACRSLPSHQNSAFKSPFVPPEQQRKYEKLLLRHAMECTRSSGITNTKAVCPKSPYCNKMQLFGTRLLEHAMVCDQDMSCPVEHCWRIRNNIWSHRCRCEKVEKNQCCPTCSLPVKLYIRRRILPKKVNRCCRRRHQPNCVALKTVDTISTMLGPRAAFPTLLKKRRVNQTTDERCGKKPKQLTTSLSSSAFGRDFFYVQDEK